jgi:hypothetical protein
LNIGFIKAGIKLPLRRYFKSDKKFEGNTKQICRQIVDKTWNGRYYQTGLGHFNYFWIRDFGVVVDSLIKTGNLERVKKTIDWALEKYMSSGKITLCILGKGHLFDAPKKSIDALPWLLHSINKSQYKLSNQQKQFLEKEIAEYNRDFINPKSGDILDGISYSELRDAVNYNKSAYAICMVHTAVKTSKELGLKGFKHGPAVYGKILDSYWNGRFFNADVDNKAFSAEGSLLPFALNIVSDKNKIQSVFKYIFEKKINLPYPMKYTDDKSKFKYHWWGNLIMPNYAGSTIWTWMGAIYLQLLHEYSSPEFSQQLQQFKKIIKKYQNFPELLHPDGKWYKVPLYRGDEGMIWAALLLEVLERK